MKKYDLDEVFSYDTFKVVRVKDRRLGLLFRTFQLAIFAYILFTIIKNKSYLNKEPPIPGAIRVTLQAPPALTNPPYCGPAQGQTPCVYWGENEIQYPSDGAGFAFFTTRASVTNYPPPEGCSFLAASSPDSPCIFDPKKSTGKIIVPKSYIANIEDYTVMIEHSIRGKVTDISSLRNGLMDGKLKGQEDNDIATFSNATRAKENNKVDGDIITVKNILDAAGVDLDAPSFAPGADPGEINRSSGVVIVILIEYKNVAFKANTIKYNYRPQVIDGGEYKAIENIYNADGSYTIVNRHGIRLIFQQTGEIGEFELVALLVNLVAALALFKVATTIVEILMLKFLPEKKVYERFKFEETHDFGDYRSGVLGDTEIAGSNNSQPKES